MALDPSPAVRWRAVALAAAVFGAGVSVYLLVEYTTGQGGVCLTGSGCDEVRASAFAYPLGVPMPLFGLVFYLAAAWIATLATPRGRVFGLGARGTLLLLSVAGVAASAALTAIEAFVIGAFCTWCLVSAAVSAVLLVAALANWRAVGPDPEGGSSGRARQLLRRQGEAERRGVRRAFVVSTAVTVVIFGSLLAAGAVATGDGGPSGQVDELAPASRPHLGSGPVTVVEFADFQCPACSVVAPILAQLAESGEATLVARHFPLDSIHANANRSSRAAEAAFGQDAYWEMSEALYATQATWRDLGSTDADNFFATLAGELGLDVGSWTTDYASTAIAEAVAADQQAAIDLRLNGTPTIFIDGERYTGSFSPEALHAAVAEASAP